MLGRLKVILTTQCGLNFRINGGLSYRIRFKLNIAHIEGIRIAASEKDLPSIHVVFINVKSRVDSETDTPNRYYGLQYDTTGEFSPSVIGIDLNTREYILLSGATANSDRIMNL